MLLSRVTKRLSFAALALLLLPIDVSSVNRTPGTRPLAASFCDRNPHTCQSAGEIMKELQLRSAAVRGIVTSIIERDVSS